MKKLSSKAKKTFNDIKLAIENWLDNQNGCKYKRDCKFYRKNCEICNGQIDNTFYCGKFRKRERTGRY